MRMDFKLVVVAVVVVGLGVGAGLSAFQPSLNQPTPAAAGIAAAGDRAAAAAQFGGSQSGTQSSGFPTGGVVDKVGEKEFSLKAIANSAAVTVRIEEQTTIVKQVTGSLSDIKPGEIITLMGEPGPDGTIAATSVQLVADGQAVGQLQMPMGGQARQGQSQDGQSSGQRSQSGGQIGRGAQGQAGSGIVLGTVDDVANNVITVTRSGGSADQNAAVKATLTDETSITKTVPGDIKDITEGASVTVTGPRGADGVVTASSIQLLPQEAAQGMRRQE